MTLIIKHPAQAKPEAAVLHRVGGDGYVTEILDKVSKIDIFKEKACPLDLEVKKNIGIQIIAHFFFVLQVKAFNGRHVGIAEVGGIVKHIDARLQDGRLFK